ncbi:MAG: cytochrome C [Hyphomonadaceae bacterium]
MRSQLFRLLVIGASMALAACAADQSPVPAERDFGSPARGLAYARAACASCHAVEPNEAASPMTAAPTFTEVANTPGMTGLALNAWLHSEHRDMPHLMVDPDHVDNLWAYMMTLRSSDVR